MHRIDVAEATVRFAELLRRVQAGEEVVVTEENAPIARIVPAGATTHKARFGAARGLLQVREDFDEPLEDFASYTT
jgi:prevent-host-death family protein